MKNEFLEELEFEEAKCKPSSMAMARYISRLKRRNFFNRKRYYSLGEEQITKCCCNNRKYKYD